MTLFRVKAINPDHEIHTGWDAMMNTFFAHVIDTTKDEKDPERNILWIGRAADEILDSNTIFLALRPYATEIGEAVIPSFYHDFYDDSYLDSDA